MLVLRLRRPRSLLELGTLVLRLRGLGRGGRCPVCGSQLYYLRSLNAYYCFNCKGYV